MVGRKPSIFWQITWRFISPLIVLVILVFYLVTQAQKQLNYLVWDINSVSLQPPSQLLNQLKHLLFVLLCILMFTDAIIWRPKCLYLSVKSKDNKQIGSSHIAYQFEKLLHKLIIGCWIFFIVLLQETFPALRSIPYPSWIYAVIFLLAGVPSLVVPMYALCRLIFVCYKKKMSSRL